MQNKLKLTHHGRSTAVERALTDFGAEESYERAAKRFAEHYGYELGRTTVMRVVKEHAIAAERYLAKRLANEAVAYDVSVAERPGEDTILVEMDGCEIRTGIMTASRSRRKTKVHKRPVRTRVESWRDVRLAFARVMSAATKTYVGGLRTFDDVGNDLFAAAVGCGLSSRTQVVGVADGGQGIRELMASKFAKLQFILDRPHLQQHLYATADAMGLGGRSRDTWVRHSLDSCAEGKVDYVRRRLRQHKGRGKKSCQTLHGYLTRFSDAVAYDAFRRKGYPIGSGEIESGHRVVPQKRLKIPGACWRPESINPMMALRILRENGWWLDFWKRPTHAP